MFTRVDSISLSESQSNSFKEEEEQKLDLLNKQYNQEVIRKQNNIKCVFLNVQATSNRQDYHSKGFNVDDYYEWVNKKKEQRLYQLLQKSAASSQIYINDPKEFNPTQAKYLLSQKRVIEPETSEINTNQIIFDLSDLETPDKANTNPLNISKRRGKKQRRTSAQIAESRSNKWSCPQCGRKYTKRHTVVKHIKLKHEYKKLTLMKLIEVPSGCYSKKGRPKQYASQIFRAIK